MNFKKKKIKQLILDLNKILSFIDSFSFQENYGFNKLYLWVEENLNLECSEYIVSMMLEPFDDIVKPLVNKMSSDEDKYFTIPTDRTVEDLKYIIEKRYPDIINITGI